LKSTRTTQQINKQKHPSGNRKTILIAAAGFPLPELDVIVIMIYTALLPTELLGIHCASTLLRLEAETLSTVGKTAVDLSSPSAHFRLPAPLVAWGDGLKPAAAAAATKLRRNKRVL
jgi:hypothetical protein